MGEPNEVKPGRGEFHENPAACICEDSEAKARELLTPHNQTLGNHRKVDTTNGFEADDHLNDKDLDWSDMDYIDEEYTLQGKKVGY